MLLDEPHTPHTGEREGEGEGEGEREIGDCEVVDEVREVGAEEGSIQI